MDQRTDPGRTDVQTLLACVRDDRASRDFEVAQRIFSDPALFDLEIFGTRALSR